MTTTVTRQFKPGHEVVYESFLEGIAAAAARFPGHLGVEVFRPLSASEGDDRGVSRFDTGEHLRAWLDSGERAAWLERAEPHVIGPMRTWFLTGLEAWFTLPDRPGIPPPRPYKMALLTWVTIFPFIMLVVRALNPLLERLPLVPRLAVTTAVTVPLMTWLVMPRITRLLRNWLYPDHNRASLGRPVSGREAPTHRVPSGRWASRLSGRLRERRDLRVDGRAPWAVEDHCHDNTST